MTEAFLAGLLWMIGTVLVVIMLFLTGHAIWLWSYRRWTTPKLARARAALTRLITGPEARPQDLATIRALLPSHRTRVVLELARHLSGSARDRLREVADTIGVCGRAERKLSSRLWWRRLHGARVLAALGVEGQALFRLLRDPHPAVRAQAAEWAGELTSPESARALMGMLTDPATLCRFAVQDSLLRMGQVAVEPLAEYLRSHAGADDLPALEVAVKLAQPTFVAPALELCRDPHPLVRAGAADLLGAIGGREGTQVLVSLLADPVSEVREAAVRALGRIGHWPAAPEAAKLLRDPSWEVRRSAALTLRSLGSPGILMLRRLRDDADRFASDMARQVLEMPQRPEGAEP